jgi:transcriptional regulator with XRE-family HTH domain
VAAVVTRVNKHTKRRLFLKEHREAKGVSASVMAGRLGIGRESVYRVERELWRVNSAKQAQWAEALGLEPEELWRPPGRPSLDAMIQSAPDDVQRLAIDIVRRLMMRS